VVDTRAQLRLAAIDGLQGMGKILLLSQGRIEQRGSYAQLLGRSAAFRELIKPIELAPVAP